MDDEILTVFERFEVVWPLGVADKTTWGKSTGTASSLSRHGRGDPDLDVSRIRDRDRVLRLKL